MRLPNSSASLSALLLATAALFAVQLPAQAGAPTPVSGPSPFAGCKLTGEKGRNYLNGVVEPWVDAHPADPSRLVAGWQQDRWNNGGSRGLVSAYSTDGGQTWLRVVVPGINKCSGGTGEFAYDRASDPWTAISPNGNAYFMSLVIKNAGRKDPGANAMLVSRSTDGGATWGSPTVLRRDTDPAIFNDKNAITADPNDARYVYATWDQLVGIADTDGGVDVGGSAVGPGAYPDGVEVARQRLRAMRSAKAQNLPRATKDTFTGPTLFARTTDAGQTWEAAKIIRDPGPDAQTIGNQAVVLNDGSVLVFFTEIFATGDTRIRFVKSTDHGATFGPPVDAATTVNSGFGAITPDAKKIVRGGQILFDVALDRATGRLYLVWQDARVGDIDKVAFAMSSDGGASWSIPAIISKTPASPEKYRKQAIIPSVEVAADSRVVVTYYDFRKDRPWTMTSELTDYWAIVCQPGLTDCRSPAAWGNEQRLTATSFNMLFAPQADGYFVGDYQGLVRKGNDMRAVFGIATRRNQTSIVTNSIP